MKIEIKSRWSGSVLFAIETGSLKLAIEAAVKQGAYLRGADLQCAYLQGAYLQGADLQGAYLRGAYLQGADLRGAYLQGADLQGAYLRGAYLRGAKVNLQSHAMIGEILRRAADGDVEKRMVAGLIAISTDWCWEKFAAIEHPQKQWALDELRRWVQDGDGAPAVLRGAAVVSE